MTPAIEKPVLSKIHSAKAVFSENARLGASYPRCIGDGNRFRSPEDEIVFRRWRLRFFFFYGAITLLLVGGFAIADRPGTGTLAAATAPTNPAIASVDVTRRPR
jgi:hypothetical protein